VPSSGLHLLTRLDTESITDINKISKNKKNPDSDLSFFDKSSQGTPLSELP
jgi:hypothetical protein